jgi:hypothetical protein
MALPAIFGGIAKAVVDGVSGFAQRRQERKSMESKGKLEILQAKIDYKVAKFQSRANRIMAKENNDASYDMQVLKNREHTLADEFLIITVVIIWLLHYIPYMQPYMASGWVAMGYEGVPWWFEFVIVGIFVSTLGLMRLFRLFFNRKFGVVSEDAPEPKRDRPEGKPEGGTD